jgi:hypothetical protein
LPEVGMSRRPANPSLWGNDRGSGSWRGGAGWPSTGGGAGRSHRGGWSGPGVRSGRLPGGGLARDAGDDDGRGLPEPQDDDFDRPAAELAGSHGEAAAGRDRVRPGKKRWVGRSVTHRIFGEGTVELQDGDGDEARLTVFFPGAGRKKILARFLELTE